MHFYTRIFTLVLLSIVPWQALANNCSYTCNAGNEGRICYASDEKKPFLCNGTQWVSLLPTREPEIYTFSGQGKPPVGEAGSNNVILCNGPVGTECGGGIYAGDGNLVVTASGCTDTSGSYGNGNFPAGSVAGTTNAITCPTTTSHLSSPATDTARMRYRWWNDTSWSTMKTARYGFSTSELVKDQPADGSNYLFPAVRYCAMLNTGGKTDWYLPTVHEMTVLVANQFEIKGFRSGGSSTDDYWTQTEALSGCSGSDCYPYVGRFRSGGTWPYEANDRSANRYIRCVRRN